MRCFGYLKAVDEAFGWEVDYAMLIKIYGGNGGQAETRYSPGECVGCNKHRIVGNPDPAHISSSYAERANLSMRMHMRRLTRLTNAFSKKLKFKLTHYQEMEESRPDVRAVRSVVQFLPTAHDAQDDTGRCRWPGNRDVEHGAVAARVS